MDINFPSSHLFQTIVVGIANPCMEYVELHYMYQSFSTKCRYKYISPPQKKNGSFGYPWRSFERFNFQVGVFWTSRTQRKELDPWKVTVLSEPWSWFRQGGFLPSKNMGTNPRGSSWKNKTCIGAAILPIPGSQMTLVSVGKGLVLEGWPKNRGHLGSRYI